MQNVAVQALDNLSPYRLTIIAAVVVVVLSAALVIIYQGPANASTYLALVGTVAIPSLLALFKAEQNANTTAQLHQENSDKIEELQRELNK